MMEGITLRYRYRDLVAEGGVELSLEEWAEVKRTPCGAWVKPLFSESQTTGTTTHLIEV